MISRNPLLYAIWLLTLICAIALESLVLSAGPVSANPFEAYQRFMPGQDANQLIRSGQCEYQYPYYDRTSPGLFCYINDAVIRIIAISLADDNRITSAYFFLVRCAVRAGDVILWYDGDVHAKRHGARVITWNGGRAASWYSKKTYWTPRMCLWGIWFQDKT